MQIETKLEHTTRVGLAPEQPTRLAAGVRGAGGALAGFVWRISMQALAPLIAGVGHVRESGARKRRLRVVETLALGGRRQLVLVMCDELEYLVGVGSEGVETIVPRQPGTAVPVLPEVPAQSVPVKNHSGTMRRERSEGGPRLVLAGGQRMAENRICEAPSGFHGGAQSGIGQELWK